MWSLFRRLDRRPGFGGGRSHQSHNPTALVIEYLEPRQMAASLVMADIFPGYQPPSEGNSSADAAFVAFAKTQDSFTESCLDGASETIELEKVADLIGQAFELDDDEMWELPQD